MDIPKPKKKSRKRKTNPDSLKLKMVISRTYSEGQKVNIGNYQSRDFFCSATRIVELHSAASAEEQEDTSANLLAIVKREVKEALKVEVDEATGAKPEGELTYVTVPPTPPPSVPDAFDPNLKPAPRPWNQYVPRQEDHVDDIDEL